MFSWDLESALRSSLPTTACVSALAGVVSHHLVFRRYEFDSLGWQLVWAFLGSCLALCAAYSHVFGITDSIIRVVVVATAYNTAVTTSILIYRAFFHRLRRFPGPFAARLSAFYACRKSMDKVQGCVDVENLHKEYGDVVRIGPRCMSFCSPAAIKEIYGSPTKTTKSSFYAQVTNDPNPASLVSCRDVDIHERRKKAWVRALGSKALREYRPRVEALVDLLLSKMEEREGQPMDMTERTMWLGFDVMGEVGLSKNFHMLEQEEEHPAIRGVHSSMMVVGVLGTVPWLLSMMGKIPGAASEYVRFTTWCHDQLREKRKDYAKQVTSKDSVPRDIMSWLLKAADEGDPSAPPTDRAFDEEARLLIIAGSDTVTSSMANVLFHLAQNASCYKKLQASLRAHFPHGEADWTYDRAASVPYLDHVIHESMRIRPPVPGGLSRVTPPGGLTIDGVFIPGDTIVQVPTWTIQRDARHWPDDPLAFRPERWEGVVSTESVAWLPFSRGRWVCPGRALAMMELRTLLGRIALRFNLAFAEGEDGTAYERGMMDTFTMTLPPLPLVFTWIKE